MDVKNFFQKIFTANKDIHVPEPVKEKFAEQFDESLNIEWHKTGDKYEAVFYKEDLEHIACYKKDGQMHCLKINLPLAKVPEDIVNAAETHGELMNAIYIECDDTQNFELIVRDSELIRFTLLLNESGEVLEKEKL